MRYSDSQKNYYVDGHEREDIVASMNICVKEYLRGEMRMHRWVQFPIEEAIRHGLDIKSGFHYISETSEKFIEFHVDTNDVSHKLGIVWNLVEIRACGSLKIKKSYLASVMMKSFLTRMPSPTNAGVDQEGNDH